MAKKVLIAYYSWSGNSANLAERIKNEFKEADIFEIKVPEDTFSNDMYKTASIAEKQDETGDLPQLITTVDNINDYDLVLVGGPVWDGVPSTPVESFLNSISEFTGEIAPFYTDGGSFSRYETAFKGDAGDLKVLPGLEERQDIKAWTSSLSD